ncbi:MAG: SDR family NAD(P)-dependent oxidoreductase [Burkholderiaceae bacterium]|nr:SDR family NAD(P)-dependent oxidoreductase [Burkholderiaceae bacterium]
MERVLITGGAGFIGSHTAQALLARGTKVRVLDNLSNGRRDNLPADALADGRVQLIEGDVRDAAAVDAAVPGCQAVLHLAAQVSVQSSIAEPVASAGHNVLGFLNVLDAVRRLGVPRMVYASSAAVYGVPQVLPLHEGVAPAPLSPYGLEKYFNDQYAALYRELYGVSSLGMRYFNVYGPRQDPRSPYAGVISKFADAIEGGGVLRIFGDGLQTRDFVYVGDVAQANARALAGTATGVLNVGTGRSVTLIELTRAMFEAFGREAPVHHEPPAQGDIRDSAMQPAALQKDLGFKPSTSLVEGLKALAASLRGA